MPLTQEEWTEVLEHTRRRVREVGFVDLDGRVAIDFHATDDAFLDFSTYLSRIIGGLEERSLSAYRRALQALREGIETEGSQPVEGIEIVLSKETLGFMASSGLILEPSRICNRLFVNLS